MYKQMCFYLAIKFFTIFKLKHFEVQAMLSKFQHLKPWFIKRLKEWNTCTYRYHIEFNELKIVLDTMQAVGKDVHSCVCKCENICKHELNITSSELRYIAHL